MDNNNTINKPLSTPTAPSLANPAAEVKQGIPKVFALIPILGCLFLIVVATGTYISSRNVNTQNKKVAVSNITSQPSQQVLGESIVEPLKNLVINEIYAESNPTNQWVEIYNPNSQGIDLSSYSMREGANCDELTGGVLPGGGYALVTPLPQSEFFSIWGANAATYSPLATLIGNGLSDGSVLTLSSTGCESQVQVADTVTVQSVVDNQSYQRVDNQFVFGPPSPGQ
jgi:hypothetical protein